MVKKIYIQPAIHAEYIGMSIPIASSLTVNNDPQDDIEGDVKFVNEWNIWGEDVED